MGNVMGWTSITQTPLGELRVVQDSMVTRWGPSGGALWPEAWVFNERCYYLDGEWITEERAREIAAMPRPERD